MWPSNRPSLVEPLLGFKLASPGVDVFFAALARGIYSEAGVLLRTLTWFCRAPVQTTFMLQGRELLAMNPNVNSIN